MSTVGDIMINANVGGYLEYHGGISHLNKYK